MDAGALGKFTAQTMEHIEDRFGDEATLRIVAIVAIVAKVYVGDATEILVTSDDDRPWVQLAFLQEGVNSLEARLAMFQDDD